MLQSATVGEHNVKGLFVRDSISSSFLTSQNQLLRH